MPITIRSTNLLIALATVFMMGVALYMEHGWGLEPCPLCVTQRIFVILVGVVALLAWLHNPGRFFRRCYAGLGMLFALVGALVSARQVWLQSLPADRVPSCGPNLDFLIDTAPFLDVLRVMFTGDGNCAEISWSLFGISIPGWTLIGFILLLVLNALQWLRRR